MQTYESRLFIGQNYFSNDGSQNFLIFQPIYNTFKLPAALTGTIIEWESKELSNEKFSLPLQQIKVFLQDCDGWIIKNKCRIWGSCLMQGKVAFTPKNVVNSFTVYELDTSWRDLNANFILKDCFFGAVQLTANPDPDKYSYSRYGIGFDSRSLFSLLNCGWGKNIVILE